MMHTKAWSSKSKFLVTALLLLSLCISQSSAKPAKAQSSGNYNPVPTESFLFSLVCDSDVSNPIISGDRREFSNVFYDIDESNATRRYKMLVPDNVTNYDVEFWFSPDGKNWDLFGIVMDTSQRLQDAWIVREDSKYYAFVETRNTTGGDYGNYVARWESDDFEVWENQTSVLTWTGVNGDFDRDDCASPIVLIIDDVWYLFYEGINREETPIVADIGYATSEDGLNFERQTVLLSHGEDPDDFYNQQIVEDIADRFGDYYLMTLHGFNGSGPWVTSLGYSLNLTSGWHRITRILKYPDYGLTPEQLTLWVDPENNDEVVAFYGEADTAIWRGFPRASIGVNGTEAGSTVKFYSSWTLDGGLGTYIFGWNNSGTWQNDTAQTMTSLWINLTKTLTAVPGVLVEYKIWVTDGESNVFESETEALVTTAIPPENIAVTLDNPTPVGINVFTESGHYDFSATYTRDPHTQYLALAFKDGNDTWVNATYHYQNDVWFLWEGSSIVEIATGTLVFEDENVTATFKLYFLPEATEDNAVDLYLYFNNTDSESDGWELMQAGYFNIKINPQSQGATEPQYDWNPNLYVSPFGLMNQYLLTGNFLGFIFAIWYSLIGEVFLGVCAFIVFFPMYTRTQSVFYPCIIMAILGGASIGLSAVLPFGALRIHYIFLLLGGTGVTYRVFGERD